MSKRDHKVESWQNLLTTRGLQINKNAEALRSTPAEETALNAWIEAYAQPSTLLTQEELVFSQKIKSSKDTSLRNTISDEAFEDAITSLQASITSIDQQCRVLESHRNALKTLRDQRVGPQQTDTSRHSTQRTRQRAQLELENETLASEARTELQTHSQKINSILDNAPNSAAKALEKDDRILDGLQKIVPRLDVFDDPRLSIDAVDTLCERWVHLERKAMQRRIDDVYGNALKAPRLNGTTHINGNAEDRAVRAELVELSSEVDGLVALVAEHHYRALIKRSLAQARSDAEAESAKWSEYTACVLLYLTARLEALYELYEHSHVHKAALSSLETELSAVLVTKSSINEKTGRPREAISTGRGLKPLRLVQATFNDPQESTAQVLKMLSIKANEALDENAVDQLLSTTLLGRLDTACSYLDESGRQQERAIAQSIESQTNHLNALLQAVHAHSVSGPARLADAQLEANIQGFEAKTDDLARRMQSLDIDALAKRLVV